MKLIKFMIKQDEKNEWRRRFFKDNNQIVNEE